MHKVLECIVFGDLPSLQDPADLVEEAAASLQHYQHGLSSSAMKSVGWVLCQTMLLELGSNAFRDRQSGAW